MPIERTIDFKANLLSQGLRELATLVQNELKRLTPYIQNKQIDGIYLNDLQSLEGNCRSAAMVIENFETMYPVVDPRTNRSALNVPTNSPFIGGAVPQPSHLTPIAGNLPYAGTLPGSLPLGAGQNPSDINYPGNTGSQGYNANNPGYGGNYNNPGNVPNPGSGAFANIGNTPNPSNPNPDPNTGAFNNIR